MKVYRISQEAYCKDLQGIGARLFGGRWNSQGVQMVYTSGTLSLSALEVLVHTQVESAPGSLFYVEILIPDSCKGISFSPDELPKNWNQFPVPGNLASIGDRFIREEKYLWMKVPSAIIHMEFNILINPRHPEIDQVKILKASPFRFDDRLIHQ